jgi:hypothetical protein
LIASEEVDEHRRADVDLPQLARIEPAELEPELRIRAGELGSHERVGLF